MRDRNCYFKVSPRFKLNLNEMSFKLRRADLFIQIMLYLGYFYVIIYNCYKENYINTHNNRRMEHQLCNTHTPSEKLVCSFHLLVL